ncbi:MAG: hypothetical protein CVU07_09695, partial [Bacteroidetes bacterium HGW-Bacteroidetes-23]
QPISNLPIKYIVYRGINQSTIVGSSNHVAGSETDGSEFVKSIYKQFNQFYTDESGNSNPPPFFVKFIGYPTDIELQPSTKRLDDMFFKLSETEIVEGEAVEPESTAYELPIVPMGMELGDATNLFGIDIILDDGSYYVPNNPNPFKLDLAYARAGNHILVKSGTPYQQNLIKDVSTKFLDYIAFVGLHTYGVGTLHLGGQTTALTEVASIYALLANCHTKDTKYLYIQSDRQRYYNFYENYKYSEIDLINIKIGDSDTTLTNQVFDEHWPVITIQNKTSIKLQLITDNYLEACLYANIGDWQTSHQNLFVKGEHLKQGISTDPNIIIDNRYTNLLELKAPNAYAGIWQLIYKGQEFYASDANNEEQKYALKDIDDLFGLLDAEPVLKPKNANEYASVIENKLQLSHVKEDLNTTTVAAVSVKRIADGIAINETDKLERVTFETLLSNSTSSNSTLAMKDNVADNTITFDQEQNNFYEPKSPYDFVLSQITFETKSIKTISFVKNKDCIKKLIGLTKDEYITVKNYIITEEINDARIFLYPTMPNDLIYASPEDIDYNIYLFAISGIINNGALKIYPFEDIKIFTLDNNCFFTEEYAKYVIKRRSTLKPNFQIIEEL